MELTFTPVTRNLVDVYRGADRIAAIYRPVNALHWALEALPGGKLLGTGSPAKLRRLAIARFCDCTDCKASA